MLETIDGKSFGGNATTEIIKAEKNRAVFSLDWTGDLTRHGSTEVEATPSGIYTTSINGQTLARPQLNLPATPLPGSHWSFSFPLVGSGGAKDGEQGAEKVIGIEKLKLGKNTYDALRIDGTGTSKLNGKEFVDSETRWLVKGIGTVKLETESISGNEKHQVVLVAQLDQKVK